MNPGCMAAEGSVLEGSIPGLVVELAYSTPHVRVGFLLVLRFSLQPKHVSIHSIVQFVAS